MKQKTEQNLATPEWRHSSSDDLELVNEPTDQLFEQGIVATFLLAQVRTNWICESAIQIKDFYFYYLCPLDKVPRHQIFFLIWWCVWEQDLYISYLGCR
jgi:hypothetical protein